MVFLNIYIYLLGFGWRRRQMELLCEQGSNFQLPRTLRLFSDFHLTKIPDGQTFRLFPPSPPTITFLNNMYSNYSTVITVRVLFT